MVRDDSSKHLYGKDYLLDSTLGGGLIKGNSRHRPKRSLTLNRGEGSGGSAISVDKPSELKIALDNRVFEIQMFWQRSNYFLVLITAIGVAVFSVKQTFLAALLSFFAALSSFYWYRTNLGSKFWQESWEEEVVKLAKKEGIASFERSTVDIVGQVRLSLEGSWTSGGKSVLQRFVDQQVITKPSVSYYMILLSMTSTAVWIVVSIFLVADWLRSLDWDLSNIIVRFIGAALLYVIGWR